MIGRELPVEHETRHETIVPPYRRPGRLRRRHPTVQTYGTV